MPGLTGHSAVGRAPLRSGVSVRSQKNARVPKPHPLRYALIAIVGQTGLWSRRQSEPFLFAVASINQSITRKNLL